MVRNAGASAHEAWLLREIAHAHRVLHRVFRGHSVRRNAVPSGCGTPFRRFLVSVFRESQAFRAARALRFSRLFHHVFQSMLARVVVGAASAAVQVPIGHFPMLREVVERLFDVADTTRFHPQF
jgi:hypothetical protein